MLEISGSRSDDMSHHLSQVKVLLENIVNAMSEEDKSAFVSQIATISNLTGNLAFISFEVDKSRTTPVPSAPNPLPNRPDVYSADGSSYGQIMAWVDDEGYLDSLEYTWWFLATPPGLPTLENLRTPQG